MLQSSASTEVHGSEHEDAPSEGDEPPRGDSITSLIENFIGRDSKERVNKPVSGSAIEERSKPISEDKQKLIKKLGRENGTQYQSDEFDDARDAAESDTTAYGIPKSVEDFNQRIAEQQPDQNRESDSSSVTGSQEEELTVAKPPMKLPIGVVQNAFDRMRPRRNPPEVATITIGSKTTTSILGSSPLSQRRRTDSTPTASNRSEHLADNPARDKFSSSLRSFAAPGSQLLKTVGKPQSKSRVSVTYPQNVTDESPPESGSDNQSEVSGNEDEDRAQDQASSSPEIREGSTTVRAESPPSEAGPDDEYLDEEGKKASEEATVAELIRQAEESSAIPSQDNIQRAHQILKGTGQRDSTTSLIQVIEASVSKIEEQLSTSEIALRSSLRATEESKSAPTAPVEDTSPEESLSLTVSKEDFGNMRVAGQFNLGFILATRNNTDLFIIDQHASDEKYNFERLQSTTIVQNQRLVRPHPLQLTAIEEEIVLENNDALLKNGFLVDIDTSGDSPVGQRCKLLSLPMSREVVFDITDLEELIAQLADSSSSTSNVPRPSKVRRMFAMRACRSSIMIGKTLTLKQMGQLVKKMGDIDKPWNCPHGRPTMRHVCGLEGWRGWEEGDGMTGMGEEMMEVDWKGWIKGMKDMEGIEEEEEMDGNDNFGGEEDGDE